MKKIVVTGSAGFIGAHLLLRLHEQYPEYHLISVDALTYAGDMARLRPLEGSPRHTFCRVDIADEAAVRQLFEAHQPDAVIHLAAESHVDRSILDPMAFIRTNVVGTASLLNAARDLWKGRSDVLFLHVSTDEVFGALSPTDPPFAETTPYDPQSPYAASKAASDHLVRAYGNTYGIPYLISNCSNNYGPFQFPEKLIPLMVHNIRQQQPLPVYGDGQQVRDWLWVGDHCLALDFILHKGTPGETYLIGGTNEVPNLQLVHTLCALTDEALGRAPGTAEGLIRFVPDRPGHDRRYAINATKIRRELGWEPQVPFEQGLRQTVQWYLQNDAWLNSVRSGEYRTYYDAQYAQRLQQATA